MRCCYELQRKGEKDSIVTIYKRCCVLTEPTEGIISLMKSFMKENR